MTATAPPPRRFAPGQLSDLWAPLDPVFAELGWSETVRASLREAKRALPLTGAFGLEVHPDAARVDLAVQLWPGGRPRDAAWCWSLPSRDRAGLPERLVTLLDRWKTTPTLLELGNSAFVEVDLDGAGRPPSVFFSFGRPPSPDTVGLAARALGLDESAEAFARTLPPGARVQHLGAREREGGVFCRITVADPNTLISNIFQSGRAVRGYELRDGVAHPLGLELSPTGPWADLDAALAQRGVQSAEVSAWPRTLAPPEGWRGLPGVRALRLFRNHLKLDHQSNTAKHYLGVALEYGPQGAQPPRITAMAASSSGSVPSR